MDAHRPKATGRGASMPAVPSGDGVSVSTSAVFLSLRSGDGSGEDSMLDDGIDLGTL